LWLKNLQLINFRNFSRLNLEFSPGLNVFEGGNGEGKTNLLEAIYCVGRGISFRTFNDQQLIKWGEDNLYLRGEGERRDISLRCEFSLGRNQPKRRKVNSRPVSLKNSNWWLWTVAFSTQDMRIVQGSPFYRRNFIDEILSFLHPDFTHLKFSFNRVLDQRNALLGLLRKKGWVNEEEFEGWNFQFLELGSKIVYLRLEGLRKLMFNFHRIFCKLMGKVLSSRLIYTSSFLDPEDINHLPLEKIKEKFSCQLTTVREKEIEQGITLIGPHRDDFQIVIDDIYLRSFGSQGEQRVAALALRLAEVGLIREEEKEPPVVLLDDITSDLDPLKERFLLHTVREIGQVFITTQDLSRFDHSFLSGSLIFHLKNGKVISKW